MAAFLAAAIADGAISRVIKSKEFLHHDPERFALYASVAIVLACAFVVSMVVPVGVNPVVGPFVVALLGVLTGRCLAHFHRRG
jgi:NADH:ubiquinone oxidoreductase subunit H